MFCGLLDDKGSEAFIELRRIQINIDPHDR
jgi:hypothetical protein